MFGEDKFLKDLRARHKAARTPVLKEEVELDEEFVDLEEATVYVKKRYNSLGANQFSNQVGFAKKINNAAQKLGLTVKMEGENLVISGDPEKIASMKKTVKGVEFSMKEDLDEEFIDLEEAVTELVEGKIAYIYENTTRTRNKIVIVAEAKVKDENIGRFQETFIKMALKQSESLIKDYREGLGTTKNDDDKDFKKAAKEVAEKANAKVNVKFFGGLGRVSYKEMTPAEFKKKLEAEVRYSGRSLKGGYFTRYLTSYFKYLIREYNSYITMTKAQVETNIEKGFWEAETELVEGKVAYIYENATRTRNKIVIISEKKELDPVNKKALKKDFDDRKDKDIDNDGDSDDSDEYLHKRRKAISKAMKDEASCGTKRMKEDEDLEEETVYVKRRYNNLGANQYSNDVGFAKKISNVASKLGLTAKMNDKNFVISGDPEKIATLKKTVKGVTFSMKEDEDLEEGKKGYKKESDDSSNDEKMTDAQKNDMDGDGEKDKKKTKKRGDKNKVDKVDTDPELENDTVVQEARSPENRKMSSYEKEKLDDLKKKHEGGKMHRALRKNYGEKGDDIFYGKLTKMATGEYDGSQSKSEEFKLTAEDLNGIESLEALAEIYYASLEDIDLEEARGRPRKGEDEDDGGSSNLIMQLRKSVSLRGQYDVKFDNGDKVKIDQRKAQTFLNRFNDLKKPAEKEALMRSASKSPKHLDMALKGKIEKPKSGKPELPPLESEK